MSREITDHGARGAGVTVLAQIALMVVQFVGMIVMARILTPDDYGLLAIVTVMMGVGALIRDFGMGTASLQEDTLTHAQSSNLFWINALLSIGAALLLALSAPIVASLFDDPRLVDLTAVMSVVLLLTGLQTQYQARLAHLRRFSSLAIASVASAIVGIGVGIATGLSGWGYWALAAQQGAAALTLLLYYLISTRWLPSWPSRGAGSRRHVLSGIDYGLANTLGYAADNIDTVMLGIRADPTALGNYNRAFQMFMQPIAGVFGPLTRVVIPTAQAAAQSGRDPNSLLLKVQSALVGLIAWILLVVAIAADELIPLLLGDQWIGMVPLIQILAIGGVFKALSQINYWAFVVAKQSRQLLKSNLVTKPLQIALIIGGAQFGVEGVAWAFVAGRAISWPINLIWLSRTAGQRSSVAFGNGLRIVGAAALAYLVARIALGLTGVDSGVAEASVAAISASVLYFLFFWISPGGAREIRSIISLRRAFVRFRPGSR